MRSLQTGEDRMGRFYRYHFRDHGNLRRRTAGRGRREISVGCRRFCVLPIFILQLASTFKIFFIDKIIEDVDDVVDVEPQVLEEHAKA